MEPLFPDDFTPDEACFASELRGVFDVEQEDLPVGYVPTLLGYERHKPAMPGFERRLTYQVFRELDLPGRPLFERHAALPIVALLAEPVEQLRRAGRSAVGVLSSVLLVMVLSMLFATPTFADGLQILLGHTGVQQVAAYPRNVHKLAPQQVTNDAQTPLYWMGSSIGDYSYLGMRHLLSEGWSKGPVVDVQYVLTRVPKGTGVLDVRMFQIADSYQAVLKVVQTGSAQEVKFGDTRAIYVDGAWVARGRHQFWQTGVRSELIFEKNGLIFWIAGDQRDGVGEAQLLAAASKMTPATRRELTPTHLSVGSVGGELRSALRDPVGEEVYALVLRGEGADSSQQLVLFQAPTTSQQLDVN